MESNARSFSFFERWFHIKPGFLAFSKMPKKSTGKTFHHFHKTVFLCSKHQRSATIIYFEPRLLLWWILHHNSSCGYYYDPPLHPPSFAWNEWLQLCTTNWVFLNCILLIYVIKIIVITFFFHRSEMEMKWWKVDLWKKSTNLHLLSTRQGTYVLLNFNFSVILISVKNDIRFRYLLNLNFFRENVQLMMNSNTTVCWRQFDVKLCTDFYEIKDFQFCFLFSD